MCLVQVPGIPLATGKQQDCLLYLVTIATGLECEAITVALCWAEARPGARRDLPHGAARPGRSSGGWGSLPAALVAFHSWRKLFSGALI